MGHPFYLRPVFLPPSLQSLSCSSDAGTQDSSRAHRHGMYSQDPRVSTTQLLAKKIALNQVWLSLWKFKIDQNEHTGDILLYHTSSDFKEVVTRTIITQPARAGTNLQNVKPISLFFISEENHKKALERFMKDWENELAENEAEYDLNAGEATLREAKFKGRELEVSFWVRGLTGSWSFLVCE